MRVSTDSPDGGRGERALGEVLQRLSDHLVDGLRRPWPRPTARGRRRRSRPYGCPDSSRRRTAPARPRPDSCAGPRHSSTRCLFHCCACSRSSPPLSPSLLGSRPRATRRLPSGPVRAFGKGGAPGPRTLAGRARAFRQGCARLRRGLARVSARSAVIRRGAVRCARGDRLGWCAWRAAARHTFEGALVEVRHAPDARRVRAPGAPGLAERASAVAGRGQGKGCAPAAGLWAREEPAGCLRASAEEAWRFRSHGGAGPDLYRSKRGLWSEPARSLEVIRDDIPPRRSDDVDGRRAPPCRRLAGQCRDRCRERGGGHAGNRRPPPWSGRIPAGRHLSPCP